MAGAKELGLNDDEVAFYDALAQNESAVQAMGSDELKVIVAELVTEVRKSVTSIGRSGRALGQGSESWSGGFCGGTATRRIFEKRLQG